MGSPSPVRVLMVSLALAAAAVAAPRGGAAPSLARPDSRPLSTPGQTGENPRPMSLLDIAELRRIVDPQLSPDGRVVVYMLSQPDWNAGRPIYHIWRQDTAGGAPVQLTTGAGDTPGGARWAPDGKSIVFVRAGQLMQLSLDGGNHEARAVSRHATSVATPLWSPDGTKIYFVASDAASAAERELERRKDDIYALDENVKPRQLWSVAVASGAETAITSGPLSVWSYRLSRDGSRIVVERGPTPLEDDKHRGELWMMDAAGGGAHEITHNDIEEVQPELSPDNSRILFLAEANEKLEPYYNANVFLMPATGGTPKPVLTDFPYGIDQAAWSPDGSSILAVANMGVHSEIVQIDPVSRQWKALTDGEHYIPLSWSLVPSAGQMIFQFDEAARFGDVWTLAIPGAGGAAAAPVRVTGVFDALARSFALPRQEKVSWRGADGVTVEGLLLYPIDYAAGRRYPLVVQMHGGPNESDKFGAGPGLLLNYFPVLAAKGYAVLRPNYRGSTGYGNAFLRDVVGGYFKNMHLDVLAGVDALIKRGIADPDRLVVMGWSAGGHLTNKLVTATTRFKAASAGAGVADWTSLYAQSDARSNRTPWFGGTPWQKNAPIAMFWNHSPVKDAANVRTPTLFFVGENDVRVPLAQSIEMYRALKSHGVPTHLYVAPREGHQWNELRHQIFKANTELAWFERYALGRTTYVPEQAPGDARR